MRGIPFDGSKLRRARLAKRMTAVALAQAVGVTYTQIWRLETGLSSPSMDTLVRLEDVLGVTAAELGAEGMPPRT